MLPLAGAASEKDAVVLALAMWTQCAVHSGRIRKRASGES